MLSPTCKNLPIVMLCAIVASLHTAPTVAATRNPAISAGLSTCVPDVTSTMDGAAEDRAGPGAGVGMCVDTENSRRWLFIDGIAALATVIALVVRVPVLSTHMTYIHTPRWCPFSPIMQHCTHFEIARLHALSLGDKVKFRGVLSCIQVSPLREVCARWHFAVPFYGCPVQGMLLQLPAGLQESQPQPEPLLFGSSTLPHVATSLHGRRL